MTDQALHPGSERNFVRKPGQHVLVVADCGTDSLYAVDHAGWLALGTHGTVTVALLPHSKMLQGIAASGGAYLPPIDVEMEVMVHLSRILDPHDVRWQLVTVEADPVATIGRLAHGLDAAWLVVGGSRWPFARHRCLRIAQSLSRRYGLRVLVVNPPR
jgi:hypothetical protein